MSNVETRANTGTALAFASEHLRRCPLHSFPLLCHARIERGGLFMSCTLAATHLRAESVDSTATCPPPSHFPPCSGFVVRWGEGGGGEGMGQGRWPREHLAAALCTPLSPAPHSAIALTRALVSFGNAQSQVLDAALRRRRVIASPLMRAAPGSAARRGRRCARGRVPRRREARSQWMKTTKTNSIVRRAPGLCCPRTRPSRTATLPHSRTHAQLEKWPPLTRPRRCSWW